MTLSFKTGVFTSRTTTGTDQVTGVGFQPKAVILYSTAFETADETFAADFRFRMGWAVDTTAANQKSTDLYSRDANTAFTERAYSASAAFCTESSGASINCKGVISALGADGFTVNWTSTDGVAKTINYICIGGSDITSAASGGFISPASTGSQSVTGVGFQADLIMLFSGDLANDDAAFNTPWGIGFATSSTNQVCCCGVAKEAANPTNTHRYQRGSNTNCFALLNYAASAAKSLEGSLTSIDSDGFTINWTTLITNGASKGIAYLALKGGNYFCGHINSPTSGTVPVSQATTGVGFQPTGLIMASVGNTTSTAIANSNRVSFAGGTSDTDSRNMWSGDLNGSANAVTAKIHRDGKIVSMITEAATEANSTINASASISSLDSDGFTLSWDTRDTTAYEAIYLAMGGSAASKNFYISKAFFRADG